MSTNDYRVGISTIFTAQMAVLPTVICSLLVTQILGSRSLVSHETSSTENEIYTLQNVLDGDETTFFHSSGENTNANGVSTQWLRLFLVNPTRIAKVHIVNRYKQDRRGVNSSKYWETSATRLKSKYLSSDC